MQLCAAATAGSSTICPNGRCYGFSSQQREAFNYVAPYIRALTMTMTSSGRRPLMVPPKTLATYFSMYSEAREKRPSKNVRPVVFLNSILWGDEISDQRFLIFLPAHNRGDDIRGRIST